MLKTTAITEEQAKWFWSKVEIGSQSDCWPFRHTNRAGYGTFWISRKHFRAHRVAFFLAYGDPSEYCVCHSCDNPPCCNPEHLFLGTHRENMLDSKNKGRKIGRRKGEGHPNAKLTTAKAELIRSIYQFGSHKYGTREIAKRFGVSQRTICLILKGRTYSEVQHVNR